MLYYIIQYFFWTFFGGVIGGILGTIILEFILEYKCIKWRNKLNKIIDEDKVKKII